MTALTVDVIRVFFAFVAIVSILTIAIVIIANTADVDSMADPAPRHGEDDEHGWPRVPDEQMRIIDAVLPKAQAWDRWVQYREAEKQ